LPAGLDDRTAVSITTVDLPFVSVKDGTGQEWHLTRRQLDCGAYYCTPSGKWLHESKPRALSAVRHWLRRHLACAEARRDHAWEEKAAKLRWILQRNGADPDGTAPRENH
jgi:hypothetical protein